MSSDLARTELLRAVRKVIPERMALAQQLLEAVTLIRLTSELLEEAGRIDPVGLRSVDAIHLAAALDLGDEVQSFVTYDNRLAAAAARNGLHVSAPV